MRYIGIRSAGFFKAALAAAAVCAAVASHGEGARRMFIPLPQYMTSMGLKLSAVRFSQMFTMYQTA